MTAMKSRVLAGVALAALTVPASAETLREALVKAYQSNPTLAADRANVRAIDENVPIARSDALPVVQLQSSYSENVVLPVTSFTAPSRTSQTQVSLTYPLFSGGAVKNGIAAAETRVEGARATLRSTEANLFTAVVGAYMDVIRDEAIVAFNQQNVKVLGVNFQSSQDRFQVGDLTRTDVAQSDARLALARSQLQTAESRLITSRENFVRLVGKAPGVLETPPPLPNLPATPEAAVTVALSDNPALLASKKNSDATDYDINVAKSTRLPKVDAFAGGSYTNYFGTLGGGRPQYDRQAQLGLRLTMPLYQGGEPTARVRQAQARRSQALEQVVESERRVISDTRSAYAVWQSSLQVIKSAQAAVSANRLALEGVRAENGVGNRTILDILDAEQEYLNSQVTLVTAQRDAYVAGFALLAAMGHAEAKDLGLDGGALYDPVLNYKRVRNTIWDWSQDPKPETLSTSTAQTPPQTAAVDPATAAAMDVPVDSRGEVPANSVPKDR